ncbi:hypothetical protein RB595_007314 [Gaeumannomyces hyphopodioides]
MMILGSFLYSNVLLINAIAILSEDRFLARLNFSPSSYDPAFGQSPEASVKARTVNLIASVRTLMRSAYPPATAKPSTAAQRRMELLTIHGPSCSTADRRQHFDNNIRDRLGLTGFMPPRRECGTTELIWVE